MSLTIFIALSPTANVRYKSFKLKISFDSGYQVSGLLGYRVLDWLGLEAELAYSNFDYAIFELCQKFYLIRL